MPTSVPIMYAVKKHLKIDTLVMSANEKEPTARTQIDDAKDHPLGVSSGNWDRRWKTSLRPSGGKRRKEAKICFVLGQNYAAGWQIVYLSQNMSFFSLCRDLQTIRNGSASKHSPNHAVADEVYSQIQPNRSDDEGVPEEEKSSIPLLDSQRPGAT